MRSSLRSLVNPRKHQLSPRSLIIYFSDENVGVIHELFRSILIKSPISNDSRTCVTVKIGTVPDLVSHPLEESLVQKASAVMSAIRMYVTDSRPSSCRLLGIVLSSDETRK